jgi:hypothetical protein
MYTMYILFIILYIYIYIYKDSNFFREYINNKLHGCYIPPPLAPSPIQHYSSPTHRTKFSEGTHRTKIREGTIYNKYPGNGTCRHSVSYLKNMNYKL